VLGHRHRNARHRIEGHERTQGNQVGPAARAGGHDRERHAEEREREAGEGHRPAAHQLQRKSCCIDRALLRLQLEDARAQRLAGQLRFVLREAVFLRHRILYADEERSFREARDRLAVLLHAMQFAVEEPQHHRVAAGVLDVAFGGERDQRRAVADVVFDEHALPVALLGRPGLAGDVDHEARQAVVEDAGGQACLQVPLDDAVEDAVQLLQSPRLRPMGKRSHSAREHDGDDERHLEEPQRMKAGRAEREQLAIAREPADAQLHAEHERERNGHHHEVRRQRQGHAQQVAQRDRAAEDDLVQLQELHDHQELQNREQPHGQRPEDLAQHHPVVQRHQATSCFAIISNALTNAE